MAGFANACDVAIQPQYETAAMEPNGFIGGLARRFAQLSLVLAVTLSPFRARFTIAERPIGTVYRDFTDLLVFWSDIAVAVAVLSWFLSARINRQKLDWGPQLLRFPLALLITMCWASTVTSIDPILSVSFNLRLSLLALFGLVVFNEARTSNILVLGAAVLIIVQAVAGLGQWFDQKSVGLGVLGEREVAITGPASTYASLIPVGDGQLALRAYGFADHPNILGGVLALAVLLVATGLPSLEEHRRSIATVTISIASLVIVLTFSRSAAAATVLGIMVAFGLLSRGRLAATRRWWGVAVVAGAFMVLLVAVPLAGAIEGRARDEVPEDHYRGAVDGRDDLLKATNTIISKRPLLGSGAGNTAQALLEEFPEFSYDYQPAHVALITVAAEIGLLGALAYSAVMTIPWIALAAGRRQITPQLVGATAMLAAITFIGLVDYYTWSYPAGQLWFWLSIGLWAASYEGRT